MKAERSLYEFVRQAWHVVEPGKTFADNWHIKLICDTLERVHRRDIRRLIINIPPRCMKSTIVSVMFPVWTWLNDPSHQFLSISHNGQLSTRDALKSRRLLQSPWFQRRWGELFKLTGDQNQKTRYENDKRGYRIALGMSSGITGEGGDTITIDDPHDRDSAHSDAERGNAITTFDEAISTRLNTPAEGAIIVIMQRLHSDDLTGHLLKSGGNWHHLCLPMEFEPERATIGDPRVAEGDPLWPEHFTREVVDALKLRLGSYGAAGQLQQRPSPKGGGIWKRQHIRRWSVLPSELDTVCISVDATFKETTKGSYVVIQCWARKGGAFYLLDQTRARMGLPETLGAIRDMANKYPKAVAKLIEPKANGSAIIDTMQKDMPGVMEFDKGNTSKEAMAESVAPLFEAGNVYVPDDAPWVGDLIEEWCTFPNAPHDDQVDAAGQALSWLSMQRGGLQEQAAAALAGLGF